MIIARSINHVWQAHKDELTKLFLSENVKPVTHKNLELRHIDKMGRKYFGFPKSMHLSVDRMGMLLTFTSYLSKGLSPEEDEKLDNLIHEAIEKGLKNPQAKSAAVISTVLTEKAKRRKLCFHTDIFYNYLCVQLIREDEDPEFFDSDIHVQKMDTFKKEHGQENIRFFFPMPELKKLSDSLTLTEENIQILSEESLKEIHLLQEKVSYLHGLLNISNKPKATSEKPS